MSETTANQVRWTTADLELMPDNGTRYEIIDGELFMSKQPHWHHQETANKIGIERRAGCGVVHANGEGCVNEEVIAAVQRHCDCLALYADKCRVNTRARGRVEDADASRAADKHTVVPVVQNWVIGYTWYGKKRDI